MQRISDYKEKAKHRHSFNQLAQEVFGIDFERWYQMGFWNDRYICYSYLDGDKVVANVSVNKLDLILNGETQRALQIGTVMTHPDYRKQGLASNLMKAVLEEYEKQVDVVYLFPEENALDFYRKFGFMSYREGIFTLDVGKERTDQCTARKLDLSREDDRDIFLKLSSERAPLSTIFGVANAQAILYWYCVGLLANDIYYLEEQDVIMLYREKQGVLQVYDLICRDRVHFYDILPQACATEIAKVVFHFTPDFEDTEISNMLFEPNETIFFKTESVKIPERFSHPFTAHA